MNARVLAILFMIAFIDVVALVIAFSFAGDGSVPGNFHPLRCLFPYYMIAVQVGLPLGEYHPGFAFVIALLGVGSLLLQYPVYAGLLIYAKRRQKSALAAVSLLVAHAGAVALAYLTSW